MKLTVLGSSSQGNCYLLEGSKETLIIELGVTFKSIKHSLNFDLSKVVGCLVTHEHKDHSKAISDVLAAGLKVYCSKGTAEGLEHHNLEVIKRMDTFKIGGFKIMAFDVEHDCAEPLGFLIEHEELGKMLFAADTYMIKYKFKDLNHIMIECNYAADILAENFKTGRVPFYLKKRITHSHFELDNVKKCLESNNSNELENVILLHLSDSNSDEERFKREVSEVLFNSKNVHVADVNKIIELKRIPF